MFQVGSILKSYHTFSTDSITNRLFKHRDLIKLLESFHSNPLFFIRRLGQSFEGRSINLIKAGNGPIKVLLWSQMHGNEPTATMALMDLLNFMGNKFQNDIRDNILKHCTLYILPMLNPDGTEIFERRNAQKIDINRDFHAQQSPEGRLLRTLRDEIRPQFGFNLHDQTSMWSAGSSGNPATISVLAPPYDESLSVNDIRYKAMQIIAEINETLQDIIPEHVGRFEDEYEIRAFGDNFQAGGTSTILIEAGGYGEDIEKQYIRKLVFIAIIQGLGSIATQSFVNKKEKDYFAIPNNKLHHFQILLRNCKLKLNGQSYSTDIGLIVKESINEDLNSLTQTFSIGDIGDLSNRFAYQDIDCQSYTLIALGELKIDEVADLIVNDGTNILVSIENGILTRMISS